MFVRCPVASHAGMVRLLLLAFFKKYLWHKKPLGPRLVLGSYREQLHLIDPAMNRVRVNSRLTHCIPCPDVRLPAKTSDLVLSR